MAEDYGELPDFLVVLGSQAITLNRTPETDLEAIQLAWGVCLEVMKYYNALDTYRMMDGMREDLQMEIAKQELKSDG